MIAFIAYFVAGFVMVCAVGSAAHDVLSRRQIISRICVFGGAFLAMMAAIVCLAVIQPNTSPTKEKPHVGE